MLRLWIVTLSEAERGGEYEAWLPRLTPEERERVRRFRRAEDRARSTAGVLLLRAAAMRRFGDWWARIERGEHGKPRLAGAEGYDLNLSHSGAYVLLAEADAPVGVDVEVLRPVKWEQLSGLFSPAEQAAIRAAADPCAQFFRIWTAREAFAKEEGVGLSIFDRPRPASAAAGAGEQGAPRIGFDHEAGLVRYAGRTLPFCHTALPGAVSAVCTSALQAEAPELHWVTVQDLVP